MTRNVPDPGAIADAARAADDAYIDRLLDRMDALRNALAAVAAAPYGIGQDTMRAIARDALTADAARVLR
jgi:hypothetical protein